MTLRCPQCRTRRATYATMARHIATTGHKLCQCGGYWYAHRPGSSCCEGNPRASLNRALREGCEPMTALADWAWDAPGPTDPVTCPF